MRAFISLKLARTYQTTNNHNADAGRFRIYATAYASIFCMTKTPFQRSCCMCMLLAAITRHLLHTIHARHFTCLHMC